MKIFVVGSHGYVGRELLKSLRTRNVTVVSVSSRPTLGEYYLDLTQTGSFPYADIEQGDVILMTAAVSSPDTCRDRHEYATVVNVTGASDFIERSIERGARIVFFSSDTVYGELTTPFDESAGCSPAGDYAQMKFEVEQRFAANSSFKTIRLSYVFSCEDKFTQYLLGCVQRGEEAELFHPFFRSIIHRGDVVDGALALAQRWDEFPQQIINFGGPNVLSRIDFIENLKQTCFPGLEYRVIEPDDGFFISRPRIIAMKSQVLPKLLGRPCRTLKEAALIECS